MPSRHPPGDDHQPAVEASVPLLYEWEQREPPADTGHLAYIAFFLLGLSQLLPWNVFMTASEYFRLSFQGSAFVDNFANYFSGGYNFAGLAGTVLAVYSLRTASKSRWIIYSSLVNVAAFAIVAVVALTDALGPDTFFALALLLISITGVCTAYLQSGGFALASLFPPIYTQAIMSGQGVAGLAPSLIQLFNALTVPLDSEDPYDGALLESRADARWRAFLYFVLALIAILVSLAGYIQLRQLPIYKHYASNHSVNVVEAESGSPGVTSQIEEDDRVQIDDATSRMQDGEASEQAVAAPEHSSLQVLWSIRTLALAVFLIFFVTLSVFPAITVSVVPGDSEMQPRRNLFVAIHFVVYSAGDWLGRTLPTFLRPRFLSSDRSLLTATIARILLLPLLLLTNVKTASRWYAPRITGDQTFMLLVAILAITNGWFSSLAMMRGPLRVRTLDRPQAGTLMVLVMVLGLATGSWASFSMRAIVCGCNPFAR
ncbi:nucleoside transporter-domain-containing protein [Thamnocephalis sphaerospora]|uniref:Nucleoside transporter-domain-containing protein n=1 Tax=Thamnocephalis sphaerospora TaxID=78915 RepID=A0A4P9XH85_9FUNG|nr:nucleoside transporter-domain-containing protein [Thamnocephalis sphaerospora]|eukprot:RKP05012.1 nucleoside transporter-domain-containing protein [Thamnocephalis sphaerospora]